jgi:predicted nucleic acid-binding protein
VIVVDASAIAEVLLRRPFAPAIEAVIADSDLRVPEHFRIEAISVLRRLGLRGELSDKAAARALRVLSHLRAPAYPTTLLQDRIWALRHRLVAYDAAYLALAQRLDTPLLTLDAGLAQAARDDGRLVALA